jgi:hypothetical protein
MLKCQNMIAFTLFKMLTPKTFIVVKTIIFVDLLEAKQRLEEAKEQRKKSADWSFIESLPPKLKAALKYYIEEGDLYVASRIAGITMDEMNELRIKAKIPSVN